MNPILDTIMNAAGGGAVQQIGKRFGLSPEQTSSALDPLLPALMASLQRDTSQEGGMSALLGVLNRGGPQYLDNQELLGQETATQDANSILSHILGSKDVSRRAVAGQAAELAGIGPDTLKQMLPVVGTMVMGGLSKRNATAPAQETSVGGGSLISSLLGQNHNGSRAETWSDC